VTTAEERDKEAARIYNEKWNARVELGNEATRIVRRHQAHGIPLDVNGYPQNMRLEIHAAMLRCVYADNWAAGRLIDDPGDKDGKPTRERKAPIGTEM
jgi:hypothetical protein